MTSPDVSTMLETALNQIDIAQITLETTLDHARHSALHSTYTTAIKRILTFNATTMRSVQNLLTILKQRARTSQL